MKIFVSMDLHRRRQRGSAVLILLILLAIMMLLVVANGSTLIHLRQELKLLEHRQVERLKASSTNATATAVSPAPSESK